MKIFGRGLFLLIPIFILAFSTKAQLKFSFSAISGTYTPNSSPTVLFNNGEDDDITTLAPIGFSFGFNGNTYTAFYASSNGYLLLDQLIPTITSPDGTRNSPALDASDLQGPTLAPLWDDLALEPGGIGELNYQLTGSSPNQILTVEWKNIDWQYNSGSPVVSFQIKLYEGSNKIEYVYSQIQSSSWAGVASIGLASGVPGDFYSLDQTDATAKAYYGTAYTDLTLTPAEGQIFVWAGVEICNNGLDDDGDGLIDCQDPDCGSFADFTLSDTTVCPGQLITITNGNTCHTTYDWDMCGGLSNTAKIIASIPYQNTSLERSSLAYDNGNFYLFAVSDASGHLIKYSFGNNLENSPVASDMGYVINSTQGVQAVQDGGNWFVFVVGEIGLIRVEFGSDLTSNSPKITALGNPCSLDWPLGLTISKDPSNGQWYGFVANKSGNSISYLNFGSSLTNQPTGGVLSIATGLSRPTCISLVNDSGQWYGFITDRTNNRILRIDFGPSLSNTSPGVTDLGNPNNYLDNPYDLRISKFGNVYQGILTNANNSTLYKVEFVGGITGSLQLSAYQNLGLYRPQGLSNLFTDPSTQKSYAFASNESHNISEVRIETCTGSPSYLTSSTPSPISYISPGDYTISLTVDKGTPQEMVITKQVKVNSCVENCNNGLDDDGNGLVDIQDPSCTYTSVANFVIQTPAPIEENQSIILKSNSVGRTFIWNFCAELDPSKMFGQKNSNNDAGRKYTRIAYANDLKDQFLFTLSEDGTIVRNKISNSSYTSTSSSPASDVYNLPVTNCNGLQVKQDDSGNWFIMYTGTYNGTSGVIIIPMGALLSNSFGAGGSVITPVNNFSSPQGFQVLKDQTSQNWYGFLVEAGTNSIYRAEFGNALTNPINFVPLTIPGGLLNYPTSAYPVFDNGEFYLFVTNKGNNSIVRLDLGNSITTNNVSGQTIVTAGVTSPYDITMVNDGVNLFGVVSCISVSQLVRIDFPSGITGNGSASVITGLNSVTNPQGLSDLIRDPGTSDLVGFWVNYDGSNSYCAVLKVPSNCSATIPIINSEIPPTINYLSAGDHVISLIVDRGTINERTYSDTVTIVHVSENCQVVGDEDKDGYADNLDSDCISANFSFTDSILVNNPVSITNNSQFASTSAWNLCAGTFTSNCTAKTVASWAEFRRIDVAYDETGYYVFSSLYYGGIVCSYLDTLSGSIKSYNVISTPDANFIEGIRIVKDGKNWYGFFVDHNNSIGHLWRMSFGHSLKNVPLVENLGNVGLGTFPHGLKIVKDQKTNNWYGFVTDVNSYSITLLDYGNSLSNIPKGTNLGNPQNAFTSGPMAISIINDNSNWYGFVPLINQPNILVRLKFGTALTNSPVADVITGISGIKSGYDITIQKQAGVYIGLVTNAYGSSNDNLARIVFPNGLDGNVVGADLGNLTSFKAMEAISDFNIDPTTGDLIGFASYPGSLQICQIKFQSCNSASVAQSTLFNPASYVYKSPGNFAISLTINQGTPQQKSLVKYINIKPGIEKGNCNNGADDDGDGLVDCADPDCAVADFSGPVNPINKTQGPTFYQDCNYGGYNFSLEPGNYMLQDLASRGIQNDDVSSIKIPSGYTVIVYQDAEFNGISYTFTSDIPCLKNVPENINDWVSSIQVIAPKSSGLSVCVNQTITLANTSSSCANTSFWNFADMSAVRNPIVTDAGNLNFPGEDYVNIDAVYDGANYYSFASSLYNKYIVRSNYGNSILNSPTSDILNFNLPDNHQGVRIMNEGGNWYLFFTTYSSLHRLDFGTSLSNAPTYHLLGSFGFNEAHEIRILYDTLQASWMGFVINRNGQSLVKLNFGNHLTNIPSYKVYDNATYFSNKLYLSTSVAFQNYNGNWYGFIINSKSTSNNLIRFYLGSSLNNNPSKVNFYTVNSSSNLYGLEFINDGKNTSGVLIDRDKVGQFIGIQFAGGTINGGPSFTTIFAKNNSLANGQGLSRLIQDVTNGNYYLLLGTSINNEILRIQVPQFVGSNQKFSTATNPTVTFNKIGTFPISLTINKGTTSEMTITKQINVLPCTENCTNTLDDDGNGLADCNDPQCVLSNIGIQSNTICKGEPLTITNNNSCVNSFQWVFDSGLTRIPDTLTIGNLGLTGNDYSKVEAVFDGTNYYLFACSKVSGHVIQANYGSSLTNGPQSITDLGFVASNLNGIQIKQDGGNWYLFIVGGNGLWKASFGNSLNAVPSISQLTNLPSLNTPIGLRLIKDYSTGDWHGFTIETGAKNIHRFDFGSSLNNLPSDTIIIQPSSNFITSANGLEVIFDQVNNRWFLFINNNNNLLRLNLGSYLRNNNLAYDQIPYSNLGNFNSLYQPSDIRIIHDGSAYVAYLTNSDPLYNNVVKLTFPSDLSSSPTGQALANLPKLNNPLGLSNLILDQSTGDQYFFIANTGSNSIAALQFKSDTAISAYSSTVSQPSSYTYSLPGTYNIQLKVNEGTQIEKTFVQQVTVGEPSFAGTISLLSANENGGTLGLNGNNGSLITWLSSNDSTANFSTVLSNSTQLDYSSSSNPYFKVIVQAPGCLADTSQIYKIDRFIIYPTISPNGDNHNDTWVIDGINMFPNNKVEIFNRWGSVVYETQGYNNNDQIWTGQSKNGGELPDGTYFYSIDLGNASKPINGYLILKR